MFDIAFSLPIHKPNFRHGQSRSLLLGLKIVYSAYRECPIRLAMVNGELKGGTIIIHVVHVIFHIIRSTSVAVAGLLVIIIIVIIIRVVIVIIIIYNGSTRVYKI